MTALPDSIIQNGLFCCWKYEERNERKTKVPYQPQTGLGAKSNDPSSFVPYKTAVQASGYDGIGIGIFNGICAIDLDNCISDSGYYTQTAAEIVALMHSYTEYSPSGNGLHILFSAKGFQYDTKRFYITKCIGALRLAVFRAFGAFPLGILREVRPILSIVFVRSFPRVGHGVGQADVSASKKPRTGFAVIFRFAISLS